MKHVPEIISVCHSSSCEGTWVEGIEKECPSVDCDNKNCTVYVLQSNITRIEKQRDELLELVKECVKIQTTFGKSWEDVLNGLNVWCDKAEQTIQSVEVGK